MSHDVFISYSSKDKPIADAICVHLETAGIRWRVAPLIYVDNILIVGR
jgi:hypothetical protein